MDASGFACYCVCCGPVYWKLEETPVSLQTVHKNTVLTFFLSGFTDGNYTYYWFFKREVLNWLRQTLGSHPIEMLLMLESLPVKLKKINFAKRVDYIFSTVTAVAAKWLPQPLSRFRGTHVFS